MGGFFLMSEWILGIILIVWIIGYSLFHDRLMDTIHEFKEETK